MGNSYQWTRAWVWTCHLRRGCREVQKWRRSIASDSHRWAHRKCLRRTSKNKWSKNDTTTTCSRPIEWHDAKNDPQRSNRTTGTSNWHRNCTNSPAGGSTCNFLKSRMRRRDAGVDIVKDAQPWQRKISLFSHVTCWRDLLEYNNAQYVLFGFFSFSRGLI